MSDMNENYKKILSQIEQKISNPEEKEFVKSKISELTVMFVEMINKLSDMTETKINDLEERQKELKLKMDKVEEVVNGIENDIYLDEGYEFEIVCPYCNNEFVAEFDNEKHSKEEVECPECHNIIELDWNGEDYGHEEDGCSGFCGGCHGCHEEEFTQSYIQDEDDIIKDYKEENKISDDEEDDEYIGKIEDDDEDM